MKQIKDQLSKTAKWHRAEVDRCHKYLDRNPSSGNVETCHEIAEQHIVMAEACEAAMRSVDAATKVISAFESLGTAKSFQDNLTARLDCEETMSALKHSLQSKFATESKDRK